MKIIVKWATSPEFWIKLAAFLLLLGLMLICVRLPMFDLDDLSRYKYWEVLVKPIFAASAFCVGFSLTIRATTASEQSTRAKITENDIKKSELIYSVNRAEFDKYKQIIENLENNTVGSLDSVFDLYTEAVDSLRKLRKISMIVERLIFKSSVPNKETYSISQLVEEWKGIKTDIKADTNIQQAINVFFPLEENSPLSIVGIKLTGINLQRIDLSKRKFENVDFGSSAMHGASLYESKFVKCNFNTTMLQGANLAKCVFDHCDFSASFLMCSNLYGASFIKCNLNGVDLSCSLLTGAKFVESDLSMAKLDGSDILNVNSSGHKISSLATDSINCVFENISLSCCLMPEEITITNFAVRDHEAIQKASTNDNRYLRVLKCWSTAKSQKKQLIDMYRKCLKYAVEDKYSQITMESLHDVMKQMKEIVDNYDEENELK